ncbi:MAG: bifunctional homocysteine S-methyltransferase/methylenetetrahydrofolate reductase [Planctomycetota bacterium]|jgi:homocysteine S-methyltransferase|nr:bifunctional homocysteine S-methyltransferase/methylenetetrahydrofolate reductase [Planctomycetota bacterium]
MTRKSRDFLTQLDEHILVADGAIGTYLYDKGIPFEACYDELNLDRPHLVRSIHEAYLDAGVHLIETNTFGANRTKLQMFGLEDRTRDINFSGACLAVEAAGEGIFVAGSVGPLAEPRLEETRLPEAQKREIFREQIVALAEGGVDLIILETFTRLDDLLLALQVSRESCDLPVCCQMAFQERGGTAAGISPTRAVRQLELAGADVIGANCGSGPRRILEVITQIGNQTKFRLSAFPNAGFPSYVEGRYMYLTTPEYLAESAAKMVAAGANLIGGCCGTSPDDIRKVVERLEGEKPSPRSTSQPAQPRTEPTPPPPTHEEDFLDKFERGEKIIVNEIDPPPHMDTDQVLSSCQKMKEIGCDAITVGDNPLAITRLGGIAMSHIIQRDIGIPTITHLACRDRNLIGTQSSLMGAWALGIRHILAITGDPARVGDQPGATSVFDLNSLRLISMIHDLNEGYSITGKSIRKATGFRISCALNPNGRRYEPQVRRLSKKVERGAQYALSQPVYDVERIKECWKACQPMGIPVFLGILPLVSERNAEFLHNEVPGIEVPSEIRRRMKGLSGESGRAEGLAIARETIDAVFDIVPAFYLITPFGRISLATELITHIQTRSVSTGPKP